MDDILKSIQEARAKRINHMASSIINDVDDDGIKKSDVETPPEEKIEKSDIMEAIGNSDLKISKTGKEISEQVTNILLPKLTAKLEEKKSEANDKLKDCGDAPTKDIDPWITDYIKLDVGYKMYSWDECDYCDNNERIAPTLSAEDSKEKRFNCPSSIDEANCRRDYNDIIRCIGNTMVDIKACEILTKLDANKSYSLTARQVTALKFV